MQRQRGFKPRPLPSSAALGLMDDALKNFQKIVTASGSRNVPPIELEEVEKACYKIEDSLAARGLLRNMRRLSRLFAGLQHYQRSIDILCNGTEYLCWVWSPITVVLQMASDCVKAFETVMKAYTKIGDTLGRFQRLKSTFFEDERLQQLFAVFYCGILNLHGLAYRFAERSSWEIFFLTTSGRFERRFGNIIESLERHADLIDREGNVINIEETQRILKTLLSQQQESLHRIEADEKRDSARQYADVLARLQIEERDQLAIFEGHAECLQYSGTGTWVTNQDDIAPWLSKTGRVQCLWLQGSLGTGKSVLATQLVTFVRGTSPVIYHYCTEQYGDSRRYDQILRSFIRQLLQMSEEAVAHAHRMFLEDRKTPSVSELENLLGQLVVIVSDAQVENGPVYVILDGAGECDPDKLPHLASIFRRKARGRGGTGDQQRKSPARTKVLFTSRQAPGFEKRFGGLRIVDLGSAEIKHQVNNAISKYAAARLRSRQFADKLVDLHITIDELENVKNEIVRKADGMFLYAKLILDYLGGQLVTKDEVMQKVAQLPKTLEEFYKKLLSDMTADMDHTSRERVRCIFRWVAFSQSPLRMAEFLSAITFSIRGLDAATLVPEFFLRACANLVEVRHDKTVAFIHSSVKDFLVKSSTGFFITEVEAMEEQARASALCLASASRCFSRHGNKHDGMLRIIGGLYSLITYSSQHWIEYALRMGAVHQTDPRHCQDYFSVVETLMEELERPDWRWNENEFFVTIKADLQDNRLRLLDQYPRLQHHVQVAAASRSQDALQTSMGQSQEVGNPSTHGEKCFDAVSQILGAYQERARWLLVQDYYPEALAQDLQAFKREFRNSTFTCRLRTCPRARDGFENEQLLKEHEMAHSTLSRCPYANCHYPPMANAKALQQHIKQQHSPAQIVPPLRRTSKFQRAWEGSSIGWKSQASFMSNAQQMLAASFSQPGAAGNPTAVAAAVAAAAGLHMGNSAANVSMGAAGGARQLPPNLMNQLQALEQRVRQHNPNALPDQVRAVAVDLLNKIIAQRRNNAAASVQQLQQHQQLQLQMASFAAAQLSQGAAAATGQAAAVAA